MAEIDNIISISITRETTAPATASFNIPLFISTFTNFSERVRTYTDIDAVADDFSTSSNVYKWASVAFGQDGVRPPSIEIGRKHVDLVTGEIGVVANATPYTLTINGVAYTVTSSGSATATNIVTQLQAACGAISGITFTTTGGGISFTVAPTVSGTPWSITSSSNITLTNTTSTETWVAAKVAIQAVNNEWYAVDIDTIVKADILAFAAAVQAEHKIFGARTADSDVSTTATTDVGTALRNANYGRTFSVYHTLAASQYATGAWIGSQLPRTPGSNDWDFKQASGVTVDYLTDTQRVNLRAKNVNMFTRVAGVNIFQDGNMADGRPIAEIIISDWTYSRLQEAIYFRLINSLKLPFTRQGFAIIENEIRSVLQQGVVNGAYSSFTVTSPDPLLISQIDRINGKAGIFKFRAVLAGSVRKVVIEGTLAY